MRGKTHSILLLCGILSILVPGGIAEAFSGAGSGTEEDPYIITTVNQLQEVNDHLNAADVYFVLGNDIDASVTSSWNEDPENPGTYFGFLPIGDSVTKFTGHLDGKGHTISGLYINRPSTNYVGLFGYIFSYIGVPVAEIKNLGLTDANVLGNAYVGGLAGRTYGSTISNCYTTGGVSGTGYIVGGLVGDNDSSSTIYNCYSTAGVSGNAYVGGLVGDNWSTSTLSNCYATGGVSGTGDGHNVGGLVGYSGSLSTISNCYATGVVWGYDYIGGLVGSNHSGSTLFSCHATGSVLGTGNRVGGLVGDNGNATISNSYATGNVSGGNRFVGGLVGTNGGGTLSLSYAEGNVSGQTEVGGLAGSSSSQMLSTVSNCYATGGVSGTARIGGLVGSSYNTAISNCYSIGSVSGTGLYVGGLVGTSTYGTVVASFWDIETSGQTTSACGTGKTTAEMKQQATFTNWDFETVWDIIENVTYPYLRENDPFRKMIKPVEGYLTSCFGWRNRNGKQEFHNGIDISRKGINEAEIVAPANGEVIDVGYDGIAGYWIKIQHGEIVRLDGSIAPNVSTSYCHLFELPSLGPADKIARGDVIGKVGSSGDSTGPHLHFIVREDDKSVNPLRYVDYSPRPGKGLTCDAFSPVDITIIDPHGYLISKNLIEIEETATYLEDDLDGDGDMDDRICITDRKVGNYTITVVPESNALPTDTYGLEVTSDGQTMVLAEDVQIEDIPAEPYEFESKLNRCDFDTDGDVDAVDLDSFVLHWLAEDCNYPSWCEGTDLNYNHFVDFRDFALFAKNWLWEKIPADIDIDGDVDFVDYAAFAGHWKAINCSEPDWCDGADLNENGSVDLYDLAEFAEYWLEGTIS